jgi:hypothetical protein
MKRRLGWAVPIAAIATLCCMLSFYQADAAAPKEERDQLANAIEQRMEMIGELKQIAGLLREQNALLKEQNDLLKSGKIKVIAAGTEKR